MAFKMKGFGGFGNSPLRNDRKDKMILRKANRKLIKELRGRVRSGEMSREEFKAAKEEIKGYTDVDTAKEYLESKK